MAASPEAQAPMNQDNSEIVPVGAPHIDQSKYRETHMSDVVDELTVPNAPTQELHQPAHFRENIDGFTNQGSRFTKGQKWMAIGAGILTLGAGVLLGKAPSNSEPSSQSAGSDVPSTSAPAVPGEIETKETVTLDNASSDQFYDNKDFTDEQRVNWAWSKLNEPSQEPGHEGMTILQAKHADLQAKYNDPNSDYKYIEDLVEPSEDMTGDQIRALQTTINNIAVDNTFSDTVRTKILAAAYDNSYPNLSDAIKYALEKDVQHMNGIYRVNESDGVKWESPVFRHYRPENGYNPEGVPSKILSVMNVGAKSVGGDFQEIYRFVGKIPIRVDSYSAAETKRWISYPEKIPYEPVA